MFRVCVAIWGELHFVDEYSTCSAMPAWCLHRSELTEELFFPSLTYSVTYLDRCYPHGPQRSLAFWQHIHSPGQYAWFSLSFDRTKCNSFRHPVRDSWYTVLCLTSAASKSYESRINTNPNFTNTLSFSARCEIKFSFVVRSPIVLLAALSLLCLQVSHSVTGSIRFPSAVDQSEIFFINPWSRPRGQ